MCHVLHFLIFIDFQIVLTLTEICLCHIMTIEDNKIKSLTQIVTVSSDAMATGINYDFSLPMSHYHDTRRSLH